MLFNVIVWPIMANEEDTDIDLQALLEKAPPSVRLNEPLVESYTFHSSEQDAPDDVDAEYILGIDEAGRGPVLGEYQKRGTRDQMS